AGFTLSERFTDAPPHLKLPGDIAAWTLRAGPDGAAVERGFAEDADVTVEADYQAALSLAQFVGVMAPGGEAEMGREAVQLFGAGAFRVKGRLADGPAR